MLSGPRRVGGRLLTLLHLICSTATLRERYATPLCVNLTERDEYATLRAKRLANRFALLSMYCEVQVLELNAEIGKRQARTRCLSDIRRITMELREHFPTMTDHPAWEAGKRQLEHVGFSSEQIAGLLSIKALYQR